MEKVSIMSSTIPQNPELLKNLFNLLKEYRPLFKQKRTFLRVVNLLLGEIFVFARHTISQIIMALGHNDADWTAWYRLFSRGRFPYEAARDLLLRQVLRSYAEKDLVVVVGDSTQTPRSSRKTEGSGRQTTPSPIPSPSACLAKRRSRLPPYPDCRAWQTECPSTARTLTILSQCC
jgi:hypothetical protein